jgi:hypothetical protein
MPKKTVTIEIEAGTVIELAKKEEALKAVAKTDGKYAGRIADICTNPKALPALDKNWNLLKGML